MPIIQHAMQQGQYVDPTQQRQQQAIQQANTQPANMPPPPPGAITHADGTIEHPQDAAFRQARLDEQAAKDWVSRAQGGPGVTPTQDFTKPIPFYNRPEYRDALWSAAERPRAPQQRSEQARLLETQRANAVGAVPQHVAEGEQYQKQVYAANQAELQRNNFLPPGITREGLISRARERADQGGSRPYISAEHGYPQINGNLENSKAGGAQVVVNNGNGEQYHMGGGHSQEVLNAAAAHGMDPDSYLAWVRQQEQNRPSEWTPGGWGDGG